MHSEELAVEDTRHVQAAQQSRVRARLLSAMQCRLRVHVGVCVSLLFFFLVLFC